MPPERPARPERSLERFQQESQQEPRTRPEAPGVYRPGRQRAHETRQARGAARSAEPARVAGSEQALLRESELQALIQERLHELATELAQGKSERLQQYLDFASRFHQYSRANQWLIQTQRPEATRVASYRTWQEEGYQVARGERGIRILAPSIRKRRQEDVPQAADHTAGHSVVAEQHAAHPTTERTGDEQEAGREGKAVVRFVAVSVFDASQLTPDHRPPEFFTPLGGDYDQLYAELAGAATADGFEVIESIKTDGAQGYSEGRHLVIRVGLVSANRALTLIHEYAHGLLHQRTHALAEMRPLSRAMQECHAEATAYVVGRHFGLPTPFSADYLLQWGATPERLRAELDAVMRAASHMIERVSARASGEQRDRNVLIANTVLESHEPHDVHDTHDTEQPPSVGMAENTDGH